MQNRCWNCGSLEGMPHSTLCFKGGAGKRPRVDVLILDTSNRRLAAPVHDTEAPRFESTTRAEVISFDEMAELVRRRGRSNIAMSHEAQCRHAEQAWIARQRLDKVNPLYAVRLYRFFEDSDA